MKTITTLKLLAISIIVFFSTQNTKAQWTQLGANIDGEAASDQSGWSIDITPNGEYVVIGASNNSGTGSNAGHVRVYHYELGNWVQIGADIDALAAGDQMGTSVAISDDGLTVVTGSPQNDVGENNAGCVQVFSFNGTAWNLKGQAINGTVSNEYRGSMVDISADGTIVATTGGSSKDIKIYEFNGTNWVQLGTSFTNIFGACRLSLNNNGNTIIIGCPYANGTNGYGCGFASVYSYISNAWTLVGDTLWGDAAFDHFGGSVEINNTGNTVIISSTYNDAVANYAGQVKVFELNGNSWIQKGTDIYGLAENDQFGYNVDINDNGDKLAASTTQVNNHGGQVRLYSFISNSWVLTDSINGEADGDNFGWDLSFSANADTIAVSAPYNDEAGSSAGNVMVFKSCNSFNTINEQACNYYNSPSGNYTWTTSGTYTDIIPNSTGCDSIITINLTINTSTTGVDTQTACDSYTWIDGNTYTTSNNTATYTLTNSQGCDSVVTLDLTITHSTSGTDVQTACDSYTWIDGNTYTTSNNTATYTLTNAQGCDSVVTLDLTIVNLDNTVTQNNDTLIANQTGATYQWIDCDNNNTAITGETNQTFIATTSGNYAVVVDNGTCSDTSDCVNVIISNINNIANSDIKIYPNPASKQLNIVIDNSQKVKLISMVNILGEKVLTLNNIQKQNKIDVSVFTPGTYFISIVETEKTITKKLIIN